MEPGTIVNAEGERLAFSYTPGAGERDDVVVLGHGLTSDKDRPWSTGIARALGEVGIASLRIAFSGNGDSEGRFVDSTITKEVEDLGAVLDALGQRPVAYVGHSMGGAVGLLRARSDPRIRWLVSLAAVTHADEFVRRMFGGLAYGEPMLDKPRCPFGEALEADLLSHGSLAPIAREVNVPWLVVHGTADEIVPAFHSRDLAAAGRCELELMEGADHSFSGPDLASLVERVAGWLREQLAG